MFSLNIMLKDKELIKHFYFGKLTSFWNGLSRKGENLATEDVWGEIISKEDLIYKILTRNEKVVRQLLRFLIKRHGYIFYVLLGLEFCWDDNHDQDQKFGGTDRNGVIQIVSQ